MPTTVKPDRLAVERQRTQMYLDNPGMDPWGGCSGKKRLSEDLACPNRANHVYGPAGYVAWHVWADEMRKDRRYKQSKCECGYFMLVEERAGQEQGRTE